MPGKKITGPCPGCGKTFTPKHFPTKYCTRQCYLDSRTILTGEEHPSWKADPTRSALYNRTRQAIPPGPCEVCGKPNADRHHLNRDKTDNRQENIEYLCRSHHLQRHGAEGDIPQGERNGQAKLTEEQVKGIREAYAAGAFQRVLAVEYGVSQGAIQSIVTRKNWRHVV